jgi:hypothetical protein
VADFYSAVDKLDISASDPIVYSELVREFLSLPVATGNEP